MRNTDLLIKGLAKDRTLLVAGLVDTAAVEKARSIHDTYPTASAAFGRVLSGALLLASLLKEPQKVIVQVQGDGPVRTIVAEADWLLRVRGFIAKPHIHLEPKGGKFDVGRAVGAGVLTVIKDLGLREYYRGSVPLQTGEIAQDLAYYLNVSEQVPAAVSLGVYVDTDNAVKASGGFMVNALPGASEETIVYLEKRLAAARPVTSMVRDGLGPKEILEEALGMPVGAIETREVSYFCPCSKERVLDAIVALGRQEIEELIGKGEPASVQCHFCRTNYEVTQDELCQLLKTAETGEG